MSMSMPAVMAIRDTSSRSPMWWNSISPTELASETMNPLNPHWSRSRSVSSHLLPEAGMPSTTLKEHMPVAQPASTAAL